MELKNCNIFMISKWQKTHFSCGSRCIVEIQTDKNRKNLKEKVDIEMKHFQIMQLNILIDSESAE